MAAVNRYDRARAALAPAQRLSLQTMFHAALNGEPQEWATVEAQGLRLRQIRVPTARGSLICLCAVEDVPGDGRGPEEHVSISRGRDSPVPSWDDVVLVRALAWPDDVRVVQELPPLVGPDAERWVDVSGAEVLHLRHYRRATP